LRRATETPKATGRHRHQHRPHRDRQTPLHALRLPTHHHMSIVMSSGQTLPDDHAAASTTGLPPATQPQPVENAIVSAFGHESEAAPTAQDTAGLLPEASPVNHGTAPDNNLHSSPADADLTNQPFETQNGSLQNPTGDEAFAGHEDDQPMGNAPALYPGRQTADEQNLEVDVCFTQCLNTNPRLATCRQSRHSYRNVRTTSKPIRRLGVTRSPLHCPDERWS
jgi:hypothetical protein